MNHSYLRLGSALVGALLVAGCSSMIKPDARELYVPARYGQDGAFGDSTRKAVDLSATHPAIDIGSQTWWHGFGDERLQRMIRQVLTVNSDLASAGLALRKARLQAGLARNDQWPQPSANINTSASRSLSGEGALERSSNANLSLSWEIDLWGRLRAARDSAEWEARASVQDRESTALALVGEICELYWNLAYLNQSIDAGQAHLEQLEQILTLVRVQFEAGQVSLLEVREAEQNLQAQQTAQSQLLQQRAEVRNAMTVLLDGQAWPRDDEPQDLNAVRRPVVVPGIPAELLGRRPDLRASELRLRKALAGIEATARSYYPTLTLTGSAGGSSASLSNVLANPVGALGVGLVLPFLNVWRMRLDTDIARTDYEIAASNFRGALYTALQEVDNALSAREQLSTQLAAAQRSFDAATDVERMYGVRYRAGAASLRIWLDAQQTLRNAELALAQIRRNQLQNDVTLYLALGGDAAQNGQTSIR